MLPLPATVVMTPFAMRRMRWLSAIYRLPWLSNVSGPVRVSGAEAKDVPSAANPILPVPATVVMLPSLAEISRSRDSLTV